MIPSVRLCRRAILRRVEVGNAFRRRGHTQLQGIEGGARELFGPLSSELDVRVERGGGFLIACRIYGCCLVLCL